MATQHPTTAPYRVARRDGRGKTTPASDLGMAQRVAAARCRADSRVWDVVLVSTGTVLYSAIGGDAR